MSGYNVGDLVAEFLAAAGVTTAFGIVSVHNIPMLDAIGRRNAILSVPARVPRTGGRVRRYSGAIGPMPAYGAYCRVSGSAT